MTLVDDIRSACAGVASRARHVAVDHDAIVRYAAALAPGPQDLLANPEVVPLGAEPEARAGLVLALAAVNFGSGWFPTLRKASGRSGYFTVALAMRRLFDADPASFSAGRLAGLDAAAIATTLGQDPSHELMGLYATALQELGRRVGGEHGGRFLGLVEAAGGSAQRLAEQLAAWPGFFDESAHDGQAVPLYKRVQITAADLHAAGLLEASDLDRLTLFADNLVPHVLRVDGVLRYRADLAGRIDAGELLEHGSAEEVEIRACAVHAVELIVAARGDGLSAARLDAILWRRGGQPGYKARPRHRARCTAY